MLSTTRSRIRRNFHSVFPADFIAEVLIKPADGFTLHAIDNALRLGVLQKHYLQRFTTRQERQQDEQAP